MLSPRLAATYVMSDEMARAGLSAHMSESDRLGLAERLLEAVNRSGLHVVERPKAEPEQKPVPPIPASAMMKRDDLFPGRVVQRYTEPVSDELVEIELPCCRRRFAVPAQDGHEEDMVCQFDRLMYEVVLASDIDGGFWANLTVAGPVTVARRRTTRRKTR